MNEPIFNHERLDVDRLSIDQVTSSFRVDANSADPATESGTEDLIDISTA